MRVSKRRKQKGTQLAKTARRAKKAKNTTKGQNKAAEYVSHLIELHKLQEVLLLHLKKEVS